MTPLLLFSQSKVMTITLENVVEMVLKENLDLQREYQKIARYEAAIQEAQSQKWASADFQAGYKRISDVMEINFSIPNLPFAIPAQKIRFGDYDSYEFSLGITQPIFMGGMISNSAKAAQQDFLAARWQSSVQKNRIQFEAQKSFFNLIKALEFKKITETSIEQIQAHLNNVNNFYQQGQVTKNEVLTVEVKLSQAQLLLTQAQKNIELAQMALSLLLHLDLKTKIQPIYQTDTWPDVNIKPEAALNPDQKAEALGLKNQMLALDFRRKALTGAYWPGIGLFGRYIYGKPGLDQIHNEWMDYWVVGLNLQWNLWDWGKKSARVQQMHLATKEIELGYQQLQQMLQADVQRTHLRLEEAQQQLQIAQKMLEQAEENFRIVENRYQQGIITNSEYLDAEAELTRSRLQKIQYQIDLQIANYDYLRACRTEVDAN
ncbi:TolC family protein [candidate division KSB1 bacterium]|nr:TolC family protein [candidate division KSB1 bacterium]